MTSTSASATYNVRTAAGVVHTITVGRTYKQHGMTARNTEGPIGRADCGSQTSSAATVTDEAANCPKCLARR